MSQAKRMRKAASHGLRQCEKIVGYPGAQCLRNATVYVESFDKWYCGVHARSIRQARERREQTHWRTLQDDEDFEQRHLLRMWLEERTPFALRKRLHALFAKLDIRELALVRQLMHELAMAVQARYRSRTPMRFR